MSSTNSPFTVSILFSCLSSPLSFNPLAASLVLAQLSHWLLGTLSLGCLLLAALLWTRPSAHSSSAPRLTPPVIPTWPWLGSVWAYTRDPVGFIRRNHALYGDVFTTTILGYRCTFLQSAPHVRRFATAPRNVLDVTGAYKLIASGVIGEEAFIGPTRYLTRLVFAPARLDGLDGQLWTLAEKMISGRLGQGASPVHGHDWTTISASGWLDHVVFALDLEALLGPSPPELLPPIASLFRVLDSDLSLLGLFTAARARARAKDRLISLLRDHVRTHLDLASRRAGSSCSANLPEPELPEVLLRAELERVCVPDDLLRAYHTGMATADMLDMIQCKVDFIALFIYGFVWAAQTNSAAATIGVVYDILQYAQRTGSDLVSDIRAELESAGGLGAASYRETSTLTRCINETLRLRATGAWVRLTTEPFALADGHACPPGFIVASPTPISLDPRVYPDPHVWEPKRYLCSPFGPGQIALDSRTCLPSPSRFPAWGVGHAHCPGQHLAYKMISIALLTFFHHFDVRLAPGSTAPVFHDVAAAGLQRLKSALEIQVRKR